MLHLIASFLCACGRYRFVGAQQENNSTVHIVYQALATFAVAGLSAAFGTGRLFSENPPRRPCIPSSLSWLEQVVQAMRRTHIIRSDKRGTIFRGLNLSLSRSY